MPGTDVTERRPRPKSTARRDPAPLDFAQCRSLGHAWGYLDGDVDNAHFGVSVAWGCSRCGMMRRDSISRATGAVITRRYLQPEGYRDTGDDKLTRGQWRVAYVDQIFGPPPVARGRRR